MRILAKVSYNGTHYFGWQKQPNEISVQEVIEKVISQFFDSEISIYASGRTDAGVHAKGQYFHFDVKRDNIDLDRALYSLNRMLPDDIRILSFKEVDPGFHARFNVKSKTYVYAIELASKDPFNNDFCYVYPYPFNEESFKNALTHFIGKHCYKNFTSKEEDEDNFVREIYSIEVEKKDNFYYVNLKANGFMRYMIRFIIGAALDVMNGKYSVQDIDDSLKEDAPRKIFSTKAPANGLTLEDVEY